MYGSSIMDGKLKVLTIKQQVEANFSQDSSNEKFAENKELVFEENHYVETSWGVNAVEHFHFQPDTENSQVFFALGMEDGSL